MDSFRRTASISASTRVRAAWAAGSPPPIADVVHQALGSNDLVDPIVSDAEERWSRGLPATLEHYLQASPTLIDKPEVCRALLMCEAARLRDRSLEDVRTDFLRRFPTLSTEITDLIDLLSLMRIGEQSATVIAPGERLGKYELIEHLGSGGFGQVWRAKDHELNRYVALKLFPIPTPIGANASRGSARLIAEARAAAALDHEHIVRVHDAGILDDLGLAYLDSQLAGDPDPRPDDPLHIAIARSLEGLAPKPPREAARIIEAASRAIASAHARGILHRDIKPGNILLAPSGKPLVADFGLAIAHDSAAPNQTSSRVVGTPAYMSPEQARGQPATPLSDVFSLGATLRFLLTAQSPYEPSSKYSESARDDVLEQARRCDTPPLLTMNTQIPKDLCAIVDRAMATEPSNRYTSADQLAADLRSFLSYKPILARPASSPRAAFMLARRHKAAMLTAAAAILLLAAGTARYVQRIGDERDRALAAELVAAKERDAATRARDHAAAERDEATRQRDVAQAINKYTAETITAALRTSPSDAPTITEALDLAERRLSYSVSERPLIDAGIRHVLGAVFIATKDYTKAVRHLSTAVATRRTTLGEEAPDTLRTRRLLAWAQSLTDEPEAAKKEMEALAPIAERVLGPTDLDTALAYSALGNWAFAADNLPEAEKLLIKAEQGFRNGPGVGTLDWQEAAGKLAELYRKQDRLADRTRLFQQTVETSARSLGPDDIRTLNARNNLAKSLWEEDRFDEAEAALRALLKDSLRIHGPHHAGTVFAHQTLADFMIRVRRDGQAALDLTQAAITPVQRPTALPSVRGPLLLTEFRALCLLNRIDEAETLLPLVRADAKRSGAAGPRLERQADEAAKAIAAYRARQQ